MSFSRQFKNFKVFNDGFSLIELMVVIAIVAILAALSAPAYRDFMIRAKIAKQMPAIHKVINDLKVTYDKTGSFPNTIQMFGVTLTNSGTYFDINFGNIRSAVYTIAADGLGVRLGLNLNGLDGIPGYTTPSTTPNSNRSAFLYGIRVIGDKILVACGQNPLTNILNMIPIEYLPAGCKCSDAMTFMQSGTSECTS